MIPPDKISICILRDKTQILQTQFYIPHPLLQDLVQCIMVIDARADASKGPVIIPYPPTPQNSLFFYIKDRIKVQSEKTGAFILQPRAVFVGPQLTPVMLDVNQNHKAVRVGFHPGGLHRLLGLPLHEMVDGSFDAADLFSGEMERLNEQLQEAGSFEAIKDRIETFLLGRLETIKSAIPFDMAMLELMRSGGSMTMEKAASLSCLSLRQFERVCKIRIGMPAKLFARIIRFSRAYRLRERQPGLNWTRIAHECGYYDQMHFIRDFREFAGVSPGILEKELEKAPLRLQASMRL